VSVEAIPIVWAQVSPFLYIEVSKHNAAWVRSLRLSDAETGGFKRAFGFIIALECDLYAAHIVLPWVCWTAGKTPHSIL
jgi:hypothetical protein